MDRYKKLLLFSVFTVFLGAAAFILTIRLSNPYIARNAVIDSSRRYIAGVASKSHWKDYKLFVYDLERKKLKIRKLNMKRDWTTYPWAVIGRNNMPAFSEDSFGVFWLHQNKKYGKTYKLIMCNFIADTLIEELKPDRKIFRFQFNTPSEKFAWYGYDYNKTIHIDEFGSSRGESFKPFEHELEGMNVSPDGRLIVTWGDDWGRNKNGERQNVKIWQVENGSVKAEHTINLEDFFADITQIHVRFTLNSKTMYLFVYQRWDTLRRYKDTPKISRSYQFNTQNWNQINQYGYDCNLTRLQSAIVSDDSSRLLMSEYTKYPHLSIREIAFEDNGQLIKEYHSIDRADRGAIAGHFYGKDGAIHAVTSKNELYSFSSDDSTPTIKHLALNRDIPYWAILFIIFACGILIV
ncbi:hypothetical protein K8T06_09145, partial [bacterium]|nr:hypothetical protein [bacterium]